MSNTQDIKKIIESSNVKEYLVKIFAEKFKIDEKVLSESFDKIVDKKVNEIGRNYSQSSKEGFGKIDNVSLDNFLSKDIKIIKDE